MSKKIIVGVDGSERSEDAVALAARLARGTGATLMLTSAYPYDAFPGRGGGDVYESYLRDEALAAIARAEQGVTGLPGVTRRAVAETSPAKALQEIAEHEDASLIVIGSSHRGTIGRVLAGTTAERLLHGAPCPVAVAPAGFRSRDDDGIATITAAYDRSAEAEAALAAATAIARATGANLRIVEVLDATWSGTPAMMTGPGYVLPTSDTEKRARDALDALARTLDAEPALIVGDPERELSRESDGVDLMVCGSRGYGPHRAVLVGSVSGRLVRDAACPVVVVPRGVEAPLEELFGAATGVA